MKCAQPLEQLAAEALERHVDDLPAEPAGEPAPRAGGILGLTTATCRSLLCRNAAASSRSSSVSVKSSRLSVQMSGIGRGGKMKSAPPYSAWAIPGPDHVLHRIGGIEGQR